MEGLHAQQFQKMMGGVCTAVIEHEKLLCELDSFVGDGDHGDSRRCARTLGNRTTGQCPGCLK